MKFLYIFLCLGGALACQFKGKTYKNDEEWTENEAFKMKCKIEPNGSWRTEVSGCVTPDKTVVPVNEEVDIGDHIWECKMSPGGQITLQQKMNKHAACNGHPFDSEWQEKSFQFKCGENGVSEFVGCVTSSGALIKDGEKKSVDGFEMECKKHENGTVTLGVLDRAVDAKCKDNQGKERDQGEKWVENQYFEKTCEERGRVKVNGCRVDAVDELIPINGSVSAGKLEYHCEAKDGAYKFYSKVKSDE
ncbi:unnamed protein product [Cylicocyclus nassatus]|uniref:Abnormal cell migration protein 18-like fibronectin type I domain-containing protein n=1 Tax=Cylicocyclus nassatus TaxID=53992 RepID=A0AA36GKE7_CYLNA|nr:unnamed protein product [Cylicocyclus nassatus]